MQAEALLASALLADDELDALFEAHVHGGKSKRRDDGRIRICTGNTSVDRALAGGIGGGNVVGVWGNGGEVRHHQF
jgi:hypothetical protein